MYLWLLLEGTAMTYPIPGPRRVWNAIVRPGRRLRLDRRGAVAVFLAFAIIPMIGFIGINIDKKYINFLSIFIRFQAK